MHDTYVLDLACLGIGFPNSNKKALRNILFDLSVGARIVILSPADESFRAYVSQTLVSEDITYDELFMVPKDQDIYEFKRTAIKAMQRSGYRILAVVDSNHADAYRLRSDLQVPTLVVENTGSVADQLDIWRANGGAVGKPSE